MYIFGAELNLAAMVFHGLRLCDVYMAISHADVNL